MSEPDPRNDWAERMPEFGPDTIIIEGDEARNAIAALLDGPPTVAGQE